MKTLLALSIAAALMCASLVNGEEKKGEPKIEWLVPGQPLSRTLADLAKKQGLDPEDFAGYRRKGDKGPGGRFVDESTPSVIASGGNTYVIAVQTMPLIASELDVQQLVLLSADGKILDRMQCELMAHFGRFKTEILPKEEKDGSRIVVRFATGSQYPGGPRNWSFNLHKIIREGKEYTFRDQEEKKADIWDEKGFCRLTVENGKFKVLFPAIALPDLSKTKSLRIGYIPQQYRVHTEVDDPKKVAEFMAKAVVKGREVYYLQEPAGKLPFSTERYLGYVEFIMPDGKKLQAGFVAPTVLEVEGWGFITFDSPAFHDAVKDLVSRIEGRPIDLVTGKHN